MSRTTHDPADDLWRAWRATKNLLELDGAGLYLRPLPEDVKAMLERHADELQMLFSTLGILAGGAK